MSIPLTARSLVVDGVCKSFDDKPVLVDVSLEVTAGEIIALLGPSGCGKTTFLRTLAGLERIDRGTITIGDRVVAGPGAWVNPERRQVGMVFQDWALFPHMSVAGNVGYGLPRQQRRSARVDEALALVGLRGFDERSPSTLSGGQQQRVALARALAPEPSVLLLDEPFSNLDTTLRTEVRTEVHRLLVELGITAVFVTHDQEEAFVVGDRVAVMHDGRIEQIDRPNDLYTRPANRWIASFVGNVNLLVGEADHTTATTAIGSIALHEPARGSVEVLVRPEDLELDEGTAGRVELVEYYGHDAMIIVRLDDGTDLRVRTPPDHAHERGDRICVRYGGGPTVAFAIDSP